jgi:hypothetical protein
MAWAGFHSIAKFRAQIRNAVMADRCVFQVFHTADCHSQVSEFESGMPLAWTARRVPIRPESGDWQSAEHWRADCQAVILVVANRGNWSAVVSKTVESSPRHFTSRGSLFEALYIFDA